MRSSAEREAMRQHPAGGASAATGTAVAERADPFEDFMAALEDLQLVVALHGTSSPEAAAARAYVRAARKRATGAWRTSHAA